MAAPTYTYTYSPATVPVDQVRLWIQDTVLFYDPNRNAMVMQFANEEIQAYITECGNLYEAAASCCESIAVAYAGKHQYSKRVGDLHVSENYLRQHENYIAMAADIRKRKVHYEGVAPSYDPNALLSVEDRPAYDPTTEFWTGQFDDINSAGGADPDVNSLGGT